MTDGLLPSALSWRMPGRGRFRRGVAAVATVALTGAGLVVVAPVAAAGKVSCAAQVPTQADALAMAAACANGVVVDNSRTEFTQVTAQPNGRLTFESAVVPQRTRKAGRWTDIDLSLSRGSDGRLRPAASVADVAFSGGGTGPIVTMAKAGKKFTLSWPGGSVAAPAVSGDAATYADVLPGVDLVVRATRSGFTHVLVVKTRAAAANPAVRALKFDLGGDATVRTGSDGSLQAVAGGVVVASAEPAVMWDAGTSPAGQASPLANQGKPAGQGKAVGAHRAEPSTAARAGDAARTAKVTVKASGHALLLQPDLKLLDDAGTQFPVYIDPAWSDVKNKWAYATNNNSNNTDYTVARVGLNPDSGVLYRSFFEFPTTADNGGTLKGKYIASAYVAMVVDHTYSCDDTDNSMFLTPVINATMKASWSTMRLSSWLSSAASHANEAGGCDKIYPDMPVNFGGPTVRSQVQAAANGNWNSITVGFCACYNTSGAGESVQDNWKKYLPAQAKLYVDYDSYPGKPNAPQVAGVACPATGVLTIGTLTPTLSAVLPDADSQTLTGTFEYVEVPASGDPNQATVVTRVQPDPTATANTRATTVPITIARGKTYAFHVTAHDPAPYNQWSGWGAWCQFTVDTTSPIKPTVTPGPLANVGQTMSFSFSTTETDVTKFRYGWTESPATEVAASGTGPKTASVSVTVPSFGRNILWVRAIDATGNLGVLASAEFVVDRPSGPAAQWGLETYPGVSQTNALADRQAASGIQLLNLNQRQAASAGEFTVNTNRIAMAISTARGQGNSAESLLLTPTPTGSSSDTFATIGLDVGGVRLGMVPGNTYTASGWIYVPASTGLSPVDARGEKIVAYYKTVSSGTSYVEFRSPAATAVDKWQPLSVTFTLPADTTEAFVRLYNGFSTGDTGRQVYWDGLSLNAAPNTPVLASNVTWTNDGHLKGGAVATFNGSNSWLGTTTNAVDTTKSFSVAAWVQPSMIDTLGDRNALGQDFAVDTGDTVHTGAFYLGARRDAQGPHWSFQMQDTSDKNSTGRPIFASPVLGSADVGKWVHIAGVYDATAKKMRLYVNGVLAAEGDRPNAPWASTGRFTIGRTYWGAMANFWAGSIADVQVFDRALAAQDFTGQLASDPASGGFTEPGMLAPVEVGNWNFEAGVGCYVADFADTCESPDQVTAWNRWQALTVGSEIGNGHSTSSPNGLQLDGQFDHDWDPSTPPVASQEYSRSAYKMGLSPDGTTTVWQDASVLRTDQSFTVAVWVAPDSTTANISLIAQRGGHESAFWLKQNPIGKWQFAITAADNTTAQQFSFLSSTPSQAETWTHLVGVYDAQANKLRLYVNGELDATATVPFTPFNANGPLLLGRTLWHDNIVDQWIGGIDDVRVFQGAMTDAAVANLYLASQ